jgi:hypothetical protein
MAECTQSGSITVRADGFVTHRREQFNDALARWGRDNLASDGVIPFGTVPYTPPVYAKAVADEWLAAIMSKREELNDVGQLKNASEGIFEAFTAVKLGASSHSRTSDTGIKVLDPHSTKLYWSGLSRSAIAMSTLLSGAQVTFSEKRTAALCGAKEGLNSAAEAAGTAAGVVAGSIGAALGKGVGSLLDEIGLIKIAIVGGGFWVASKVL